MPPPFDFRAAATSYGWIALASTVWLAECQSVRRVERLPTGEILRLELTGAGTIDRPLIQIQMSHSTPPTAHARTAT